MAQFKGTIYTSAQAFTIARFGDDAHRQALASLAEEDRKVLDGVTSVGWYDTKPVLAYHRAVDRLHGTGNLALCVDIGHFSAEWALNNVLKIFLRFKSPNWIMERSTSLWQRFHDSGRWEQTSDAQTQLIGRLYDFKVRDEAFCARLQGWLLGAIELTGGKQAQVVEPTCTSKGGRYCEFHGRWS